MFSYLRYFSVVSFVVVMVTAVLVGIYFRQIAADDLKAIVEQSNSSLARGFVNTTWKKHQTLFEQLASVDVQRWARYPAFIEFSRDAFRYFEEIPVTKLNIYTPTGKRFLSTNQSEIQFFDSKNSQQARAEIYREGFDAALKGQVFTRIVPEGKYIALDGTEHTATLVQSFIPIISDTYVPIVAGSAPEAQAVIEVFYDVTDQWSQLWLFQVLGTGGIVVIFLILFAALMYTSHKAEGIIAKQHESNLELTAAAARAEAASREKSKFLANISHELRTPLNAIIGFSEIIKNEMMGDLGNPQYIDYINDIHSSGVHLLSLINDILDYSKAEAGKLELEVSQIDATKLIKTSMRLVSPRAESAEVKLVEQIPKEHFVINTDGKKFKQVLLNLLSNAVKFTPPGGEVKVSAWQNVADGAITVEVADTGIGIAPKDISKAMAPFGQVDSELSRRYEGTGLGLPLTKRLVEVMGGSFDIKSELNVGTTITFTIPREAPERFRKKEASISAVAPSVSYAEKPAPTAAPLVASEEKKPQLSEPAAAPVALASTESAAPSFALPVTPAQPAPPPLVAPEEKTIPLVRPEAPSAPQAEQYDPFKSYAPPPGVKEAPSVEVTVPPAPPSPPPVEAPPALTVPPMPAPAPIPIPAGPPGALSAQGSTPLTPLVATDPPPPPVPAAAPLGALSMEESAPTPTMPPAVPLPVEVPPEASVPPVQTAETLLQPQSPASSGPGEEKKEGDPT